MKILIDIISFPLSVLESFIGYVITCILAFIISSLFVKNDKIYKKDNKYYRFILNSGTGFASFVCNIRTKFVGKEKLPKDGKFLLVSNHVSNWDPILTWFALRDNDISFISKPENLEIPFFGWVAKRCCFLPIDRKSARNALATIDNAADILSSGELNMGVYPEGTRHKDCVMGPFHNSVFKIAQKANVPIVVVSVKNTNLIAKNAPFKKTEVIINVCDVLYPEEFMDKKTCEIGEKVREMIEDSLK